jgi:hypothetical protein
MPTWGECILTGVTRTRASRDGRLNAGSGSGYGRT